MFDVLLDDGQGCCADARNKIATTPENWLLVLRPQRRKFFAQRATRHGFEVVGHDAGRAFWVEAEQQMDVVFPGVHLDQLGIPVLAKRMDHGLEPLEHRAIKALAAVLRHKNELVTKRIAAMKQFVDPRG